MVGTPARKVEESSLSPSSTSSAENPSTIRAEAPTAVTLSTQAMCERLWKSGSGHSTRSSAVSPGTGT